MHFAGCRSLKQSTEHAYRNGIYVTTTENRCFETVDGGSKRYDFNWGNPTITGTPPEVMPDVRAAFWQKIEAVWAMRDTREGSNASKG